MRSIIVWIFAVSLCVTSFAQPVAKITGPKESPPGEMVVLSSTGSTGDNLKWIKPEGLQTLQVGCAVLDTQVVFATNKPGVYKFVLIVADKQAAIDYVEHTVTIGTPGNGPGPVPGPAPNPTPAPNPSDPSRWSGLQNISKEGADRINDAATRSKLKATIAAVVLDIDSKCAAGQCPTVDAAKDQVRRSIEATLLTRLGPSAKIDWSLWRKANQTELDRVGLADIKDYVAALKSIGSGL